MDVFNSIIGYDLTTSNTYYRCPITITQVTINYIAISLESHRLITFPYFRYNFLTPFSEETAQIY